MFFIQRLVFTTLSTIAVSFFFMAIGSGVTLWLFSSNPEKICQIVQSKNILDWWSNGKE